LKFFKTKIIKPLTTVKSYSIISKAFIKCITPAVRRRGGKSTVSEVRVKENEPLDSALRRFKRQCAKAGVIQEVRKREAYDKPSVRRKKKSEAARKRKYR